MPHSTNFPAATAGGGRMASCLPVRYLAPALLSALTLAGCGAAQPKSSAPSRTAESAAFKGAPAPMASLHHQANRLLQGRAAGAY